MNWNHRVMRDEDGLLCIVEAYYDEGDNKPHSYTEPFMCADDEAGLRTLVERLAEAIKQPVLEIKDFKYVGGNDGK